MNKLLQGHTNVSLIISTNILIILCEIWEIADIYCKWALNGRSRAMLCCTWRYIVITNNFFP
jgi:hypothetical protein